MAAPSVRLGVDIGGTFTDVVLEKDGAAFSTESRFEQYDLNLNLPDPLLPRQMRFTVGGRVDARGEVLVDIDRAQVEAVVDQIAQAGFESVAVGLIHSYLNPAHEENMNGSIRSWPMPISSR